MNKVTILTLSCLAVIIACQIFTMAYAQSTEENVNEIEQATGYMYDLGAFATGCSDEMTNQKAVNECMAVIRAFNQHMEQLWSVHGDAINKYRMQGAGGFYGNGDNGSNYGGGYYN
jgi:hypothetical protein